MEGVNRLLTSLVMLGLGLCGLLGQDRTSRAGVRAGPPEALVNGPFQGQKAFTAVLADRFNGSYLGAVWAHDENVSFLNGSSFWQLASARQRACPALTLCDIQRLSHEVIVADLAGSGDTAQARAILAHDEYLIIENGARPDAIAWLTGRHEVVESVVAPVVVNMVDNQSAFPKRLADRPLDALGTPPTRVPAGADGIIEQCAMLAYKSSRSGQWVARTEKHASCSKSSGALGSSSVSTAKRAELSSLRWGPSEGKTTFITVSRYHVGFLAQQESHVNNYLENE